jgi:hypothetical protein
MPEKITFEEDYCDTLPLLTPAPEPLQDLTEYKKAHLKFEAIRSGTTHLPFGGKELVSFSNFLPSTIVTLIQRNPNAKFIRIFNGVRDNNAHYIFMTAVDNNEKVLETLVVENCCQCPPRCTPPQGGF